MIEPLEGMPPGVIGLRASGKVSAEDYRDILAPTLERALADGGKVRLVYELGADYDTFEAGGVWQDMRLGASHFNSFERMALGRTWTGSATRRTRSASSCPAS